MIKKLKWLLTRPHPREVSPLPDWHRFDQFTRDLNLETVPGLTGDGYRWFDCSAWLFGRGEMYQLLVEAALYSGLKIEFHADPVGPVVYAWVREMEM